MKKALDSMVYVYVDAQDWPFNMAHVCKGVHVYPSLRFIMKHNPKTNGIYKLEVKLHKVCKDPLTKEAKVIVEALEKKGEIWKH